jgi:hypothetical protein
MRRSFIARVFTSLGVIAPGRSGVRHPSGMAGTGLYRFDVNTSPLGSAAILAGKAFVIVFAIAEIPHARDLAGSRADAARAVRLKISARPLRPGQNPCSKRAGDG